jgi:hypothetical protein
MAFGSFASCSVGDIGEADGAGVVDDVRGDAVLRATTRCFGFCGRATCFGASTRMLGSEVVAPPEGVAVCAIAVPLRPHSSSAIDKIATASTHFFWNMSRFLSTHAKKTLNAGTKREVSHCWFKGLRITHL